MQSSYHFSRIPPATHQQKHWTVPCPRDITRLANIPILLCSTFLWRWGPQERNCDIVHVAIGCCFAPTLSSIAVFLGVFTATSNKRQGLPSLVSTANCVCFNLLALSVHRKTCMQHNPLESFEKWHAKLCTSKSPSTSTEHHGFVPSCCYTCLAVCKLAMCACLAHYAAD